MPSTSNDNGRDLLDSAANIFRGRITPGSRYQALLDGGLSAGLTDPSRDAMAQGSSGMDRTKPDSTRISLPATERLSRSVEFNLPQIGDMPPEPPTLRGRMGAVLVGMVRRGLFWYTAQIKAFHAAVADAARELAPALQDLNAQQQRQRTLIGEGRERIAELERWVEENQAAIASSLAAAASQPSLQDQFRQLDQTVKSLEQEVDETHASLRQEQQRLGEVLVQYQQTQASHREQETLQTSALIAKLTQIDGSLAELTQAKTTFEEGLGQNLKTEFKEIRQQVHEARTHLLRQELRLKMLVREVRKRAIPPGDVAAVLTAEVAHIHDPLFVDHAVSFRGSRADIKKRLAVYLPYVQEAFSAAMRSPALDLACGRGEWMELLEETGIPAKGIDFNRELVDSGRDLGLDMIQGDIFEFLETLPDESRSMVTAFHILEHIRFPDMVYLIDQAVRILKPGGIVIFETPNPKNLFVSSNNFYLDPTHLHPIPSEFLAFLVEARGLCDPKVLPLSPYPDYFHLPESDCPAVRFINDHFYGSQDYGIVATKS
jgi:2-polyprenyl-3-methyl-5-hydroxy-6-metoxy-1,4-benzoquinol methylase